MSGRLTRAGYEKLIAEDLAWIDAQPSTLESRHIRMIVERSPDHQYGERAPRPDLLRRCLDCDLMHIGCDGSKIGMCSPQKIAEREPVSMIMSCPSCGARHIDEGEFATKPHHTHACQKCGMCWRPAIVPTCGVRFLPGFKNSEGE